MYNGGLITFKFKNIENLKALCLSNLDIEINETGILVKEKESKNIIGYIERIVGISFKELLSLYNYNIPENAENINV